MDLEKEILSIGSRGKSELDDTLAVGSRIIEAFSNPTVSSKDIIDRFQNFIVKAISEIPNVQHIYAVLTTIIASKFQAVSQTIILRSLNSLQTSVNNDSLNACKNILSYLTEITLINLMSSLTLSRILKAFVNQLSKVTGNQKSFYLSILNRIIPMCWLILSVKFDEQLEEYVKDIDKIIGVQDNLTIQNQWRAIMEQFTRKKLRNYSLVSKMEFNTEQDRLLPHYVPNFELNFKNKLIYNNSRRELALSFEDADELYNSFSRSLDAYMHRECIISTLQCFRHKKALLIQRIQGYMNYYKGNIFLTRLLTQTLFSEAILNESIAVLVISSILVHWSISEIQVIRKNFRKQIQNTALNIFNRLQQYPTFATEQLSDIISFYLVNHNPQIWHWKKWVAEEKQFVKRKMLLLLSLQKIITISDKLVIKDVPKELEKYLNQSKICIKEVTSKEDEGFKQMIFQKVVNLETDFLSIITSPKEYEIFLQCLLTRMSNSRNHLHKQFQNYQYLLLELNQRFNRGILIQAIYNFWTNHQYHKIEYFTLFIQKNIIEFHSLVEYVIRTARKLEQVDKLMMQRFFNKVSLNCGITVTDLQVLQELQHSFS